MKTVTIVSLLLFLASPVFGQLTKEDVRTIMKEETAASEKRIKEYIDLKIDGVEKSLNARIDGVEKSLTAKIDAVDQKLTAKIETVNAKIDAVDQKLTARIDGLEGNISRIWLAILALIAAAVALPQLIIVYAERKRGREIQMLLEQLREKTDGPETGGTS